MVSHLGLSNDKMWSSFFVSLMNNSELMWTNDFNRSKAQKNCKSEVGTYFVGAQPLMWNHFGKSAQEDEI